MEAGLELDKLIAEKVFGLVPCQGKHEDGVGLPCYADPEDSMNGSPLHPYSVDLQSSWAAVDKANLFSNDCRSLIKNQKGLWEVRDIDYQAGDWETLSVGKTVPEALCLAVLAKLTADSAPAAPPQNHAPTLIGAAHHNAFAGKSFIETLRDRPSDAENTGEKTTIAPAARPQISHCPVCEKVPPITIEGLADVIEKAQNNTIAPAVRPEFPDLPIPTQKDLAKILSKPIMSDDARKKRQKNSSAPAAPTRISKVKRKRK